MHIISISDHQSQITGLQIDNFSGSPMLHILHQIQLFLRHIFLLLDELLLTAREDQHPHDGEVLAGHAVGEDVSEEQIHVEGRVLCCYLGLADIPLFVLQRRRQDNNRVVLPAAQLSFQFTIIPVFKTNHPHLLKSAPLLSGRNHSNLMPLQFGNQQLHNLAPLLPDHQSLSLGAQNRVLDELTSGDEDSLQHPARIEQFEGLLGGHKNHNYKEQESSQMIIRRWAQLFSVQKFDPTKDYYRVLGLSPAATQQQLKQAYKNKAKLYHPDVNKGKDVLFKEINEAYQLLSSQEDRKLYDQARSQKPNPSKSSPPPHDNYQNYHQNTDHSSQSESRYYEEGSPEMREHLRRQYEKAEKKYTQQRNNYDHLGRGYEGYQKFTQEMLRKKAQKYKQKDRVTLDSVKKQEELHRQSSQARDQAEFLKKQQELKATIKDKISRATSNAQQVASGLQEMGRFIKDIFKRK